MAKRFGGAYSPNAKGTSQAIAPAPKVKPAGMRNSLMFAPSIVVAATGLNDGATGIALSLAAAGAWALSAFMLGQGVKAEIAYNERKIAKRPAIPRKIFAAALCGIGVGIAAYRNDGNLFAAAILGGLGIALFLLSFGIDPMRDKGATGVDQFQSDRVARAVDQGETYLREMQDAILRANDRNLTHRVSQFATTARDMFRTVEEDPRDLTSARKFMSVYLQGARDATIVFADIYARSQDAEARSDYQALLDDLEQNFAAKTRKMLLEDKNDLTVEISVLQDRLKREGIQLD